MSDSFQPMGYSNRPNPMSTSYMNSQQSPLAQQLLASQFMNPQYNQMQGYSQQMQPNMQQLQQMQQQQQQQMPFQMQHGYPQQQLQSQSQQQLPFQMQHGCSQQQQIPQFQQMIPPMQQGFLPGSGSGQLQQQQGLMPHGCSQQHSLPDGICNKCGNITSAVNQPRLSAHQSALPQYRNSYPSLSPSPSPFQSYNSALPH